MADKESRQIENLLKRLPEIENVVFYRGDTVANTLVKKLKKSTYPKDWTFLSIYQKMKAAKVDSNEKYNKDSEKIYVQYLHTLNWRKKPRSLIGPPDCMVLKFLYILQLFAFLLDMQ